MTGAIHFRHFVDLVCQRSPFQRKKLETYLSERDAAFFSDAEHFFARYEAFLRAEGVSLDAAVAAYLKLCNDMMTCQVSFMRTGRYPTPDAASAIDNVYNNPGQMVPYMIGLALSQFLWETHHAMYTFFSDEIRARRHSVHSYLEIGPGHGLFLDRAVSTLESATRIVVVDISPTSLEISRKIMNLAGPWADRIRYLSGDILGVDLGEQFDFITMGEVLEHVEAPARLLAKVHESLTLDGRAFISTCANCPALDHVYQFHTVNEIRELLRGSGFEIERDGVYPVERLPMEEIVARRITINYCAIVKRQGNDRSI